MGGLLTNESAEILSEPHPWHGDSMGAIFRAIVVLGGSQDALKETRVQLETLKHLYFFDHGLREQGPYNPQSDT